MLRPVWRGWRDTTGHEVDILADTPEGLRPLEIKSGCTYASDWPQGLRQRQTTSHLQDGTPALLYGGKDSYAREGLQVLGWQDLGQWCP